MAGTISRLVRKAVTDGLADLPALKDQGVQVTYSWDSAAISRVMVFTASPRAETPPAALRSGRNHRDETGEFRLVVLVVAPGGDAFDAESRLDEFAPVVEEWLADRKSNELGVPGLQTLTVVAWEGGEGRADEGWVSERIYTVRYTARLT